MRLVTFAPKTHPSEDRVGVLEDGQVHPLDWRADLVSMIQYDQQPDRAGKPLPLEDVRLKAPVRPRKIIGVGRNYADHAAELGNTVPESPLLFGVFSTAVIGDGDLIRWKAALTQQVDWEGELAVVIGNGGWDIPEAEAMAHVYGYTAANDVSARDLQSSDGQWVRAKGMDTFCPLGPCLVTRDMISDPYALRIQTDVNDERMQDGSVRDMIFTIPALIAHCSRAFTLEPGDVILTGTPAGVGKAQTPPRYLQHDDVVRVTIDGIGTLTNRCYVDE